MQGKIGVFMKCLILLKVKQIQTISSFLNPFIKSVKNGILDKRSNHHHGLLTYALGYWSEVAGLVAKSAAMVKK